MAKRKPKRRPKRRTKTITHKGKKYVCRLKK
jgi:hypothetical protein